MIKRYASFCFIFAALLTASFAAAESVVQLQPRGYVNDFAHVLSPQAASQIEELCRQVDQKAHAQIAVVTVNSLEGSDIDSYAVDLFKKWGIGDKASNRGVLILLAPHEHRYRIEVGYGLEPILPDGKVGSFGREAVPYLRNNDFDHALLFLTTRVAEVVAKDANVEITRSQDFAPEQPEPPPHTGLSIGIIAIIVIVLLLVIFSLLRLLLWWLFLGSLGGGRRGGYSGGGWGGGFGGGGFGGFGGGSSGGGGASGSW